MIEALRFQTHAEVDKFALEFGLEDIITGKYINEKEASIIKHLIKNPQLKAPNGTPIIQGITEYLILSRYPSADPKNLFPELVNSLDHDGFKLNKNGLRSKLPTEVPIIDKENELVELLDKFGYSTAKGHYEQAIAAHTRGDWAAANSQLRSFAEEFFNRASDQIAPGNYKSSHKRREVLADKGFFRSDLNEWINNGSGFIQGFWKRLHPEGSHPGLSEKEDSTFRIHLVIVVIHYLAKRLYSGIGLND